MPEPSTSDEFIQHLTGCQHWLRAYVRALVGDRQQADDLLQRTNLVLWKKSADFAPGTNFRAWACQVARYEVLAFRKEQSRDRLRFSDAAFNAVATDAESHVGVLEDLREFLEDCLEQLPSGQRQLIAARYASDGSVQEIAQSRSQSVDAVSASLYRIRKTLLKCIRGKLKAEEV